MIHEQSRTTGIVWCGILGSLSILGMVAIEIAGRNIPPTLATVAGVALGVIGTLVNTFTAERPGQVPPRQ